MAIATFTGGSRDTGPSGGDYFIGFIILLITIGWIVCALGDFFMLTKVRIFDLNNWFHLPKTCSKMTKSITRVHEVENTVLTHLTS